ncbi:hypothetical protein GTA08_BOTSDO13248 [Botryosphaeria dothidea]|uniref:Vacuolar ATPase assembly integral membrane protein VMA21 n=1 Tax=Botryosphaeria dothidea TaxID=55169 RepID=A0A8H4N9W9_9PEZI|nr:hypothetical protein GTA08_BOTSDO13248 [Botryosphaeria dothidea]
MASRRIVSTEKTVLDQDDAPDSGSASQQGPSNIAPAVPSVALNPNPRSQFSAWIRKLTCARWMYRAVIFKLLGFTFAMITLPIGTYFMTVNTVFKGNSTFAGGLAAIMANVVLVAYVIVAMKEDQSDRLEAEAKAKKAR